MTSSKPNFGPDSTYRQAIVFVLLFLIPAAQALLPIDDPDIWWHLRTGQWIIEHGRLPWTDPFSSYGAGKVWIAYSWLFEILVYAIYSRFGLLGLVLFNVIFSLVIAVALYLLVRRAGLPFLAEIAITAVALFCLKPLLNPRPWLFSILFFIVELHILLSARSLRKHLSFFFLPLLFVVWANVHVQFIYGLAALAIFAAEPLFQKKLIHAPAVSDPGWPSLRLRLVILLLSFIATLATPYHVHLYQPIFEYALQTRAFQNIEEFHPMFFRSLRDWLVLALTLGAAFSLGWHRERRLFSYLLFAMGVFLAFRARRDVWVLVIVSLTTIVQGRTALGVSAFPIHFTLGKLIAISAALILSLFAFGYSRKITERGLERHVANYFPANAVAFIKNNFSPQPLYNELDWGGYLIWTLPNWPVSMDGRTNLQGEARLERSLATWAGFPGWDKDPELAQAQLIVARRNRPLTFLLHKDPRFRLVHQDDIADIFVTAHK